MDVLLQAFRGKLFFLFIAKTELMQFNNSAHGSAKKGHT